MKNPRLTRSVRFVVVRFPSASLSFRNQAIKQLNRQLKKRKLRLFQHNELFAPTREWSEEATRVIYERNGIDAGCYHARLDR